MSASENEEFFTISLTGDGIDVTRKVNASKLALIMGILVGRESTAKFRHEMRDSNNSDAKARLSLREFLDSARVTTKSEQIAAIGQYMSTHEGKDTFSREDIKIRFQTARERLPANLPRDFATAIAKGMIAEDHRTPGQYYVTTTGAKAVGRYFGDDN